MEKKSGYLRFISYLQIIGILLVVAGHSMHEYPDGHNGTETLFYRALYSFHMPLFLFISGFLMVYTTKVAEQAKRTPKGFLVNKLKRLMLPFVVLTAVTFIPRAMMSGISDDALPLSWHTFMMSFLDNKYMPIPFFWFLQASFVLLIVSFCTLYFSRKARIPAGITAIFMCLLFIAFALSDIPVSSLFSIADVKRLGMFFVLGCTYCIFANRIDAYIPWGKWSFFTLMAVLWAASFALFEETSWILLCSFLGIIMCISFAKIMEQRNWQFLDHLQGANYLIFLLSWYCNVITQQVLSHFVDLPWWVHSILSLVSGVYIPWLGYKYLERHQNSRWIRVTSFLLGQSFSSHK